jgi:hypothetical protein
MRFTASVQMLCAAFIGSFRCLRLEFEVRGRKMADFARIGAGNLHAQPLCSRHEGVAQHLTPNIIFNTDVLLVVTSRGY